MSNTVQSSYSKAFANWINGSQHRHGRWLLVLMLLAVLWLEVPAWAQSCSVSISLNPSAPVAGQSVTFTANVQGVPPVDNDNASVTLDGSALCSTPGQQGLQCSATVSNISAGTHTLGWNCSFNGTGGNGSNSGSQQFTVSPAPTPTPTPTPNPTPTPTPTPTPLPTGPGTANPKYIVLSVIYAPPGKSSFVDYGKSTMLATDTAFTQSFNGSQMFSVSVTVGPKQIFGNNFTNTSTETVSYQTDSNQDEMLSKTTNFDIVVPGPANSANGINHDYDVILLWINPVLNLNVTNATTAQWTGFSFDSNDPANEVDVIPVYVGWLKNPSTMPPSVANALARTWAQLSADGGGPGLTSTDFQAILAQDPFSDPNYVPTLSGGTQVTQDKRFDLVAGRTLSYAPPPDGGQPITEAFSLQHQDTSSTGKSAMTGYKVSYSISATSSVLGFFKTTFTDTKTLSWTSSAAQTTTSTVGQTASLSITSPSQGYTGPTQIQVFQDNVYGSFMFAFVPEEQTPDYFMWADPGTQHVPQSATATYTVGADSLNGFNGSVALSAGVLPSGCGTPTFNPASITGTQTSTLTLSCSTAGSYTITITGTSGSLTKTTQVNLVVDAVPFSITATPGSQAISPGGTATFSVTSTPANGFGGSITLSAASPTGCGPVTFNPATISGVATSTVTIPNCGTPGNYSVSIAGTSGSFTATTTPSLVVAAPPASNPPGGGCTVTTALTPAAPVLGQPLSFTATLGNIVAGNNYQGSVNLDGQLICNIPNGASTCSGPMPPVTPSTGTHAINWSCNNTTGATQTGSGTQFFTVADAIGGTFSPKFLVLSVLYAPPGQASFVDYTSSTQLGTSTTLKNTFSQSNGLSVTAGAGITIGPFSGSVSANQTHTYTYTGQTNQSVSLNKTASSQIQIFGPAQSADGINHDFDVILVWINPIVSFNISDLNKMQITSVSFDPADPVNEMDVVPLYVGWLKNPSTMPPLVADILDRVWAQAPDDGSGPGLTAADFASILASDPFTQQGYTPVLNPGATTTADNRFDLAVGQSLSYEPPPSGDQPLTENTSLVYQQTSKAGTTATDSHDISYTKSTSGKADISIDEFIKLNFNLKVQTNKELTWTNQNTQTTTTGTTQSAALSLTGPSAAYSGPTQLQVFQDNVYGTFMFAFSPDTKSPTFNLLPSPGGQTVIVGQNASFNISLLPLNGFNASVNLSATVPSGCGPVTFTPASISGTATSTATLSCSAAGNYSITITGSSGTIQANTTVTLAVLAAPSFSLAVSPVSAATTSGGTATLTVSASPIDGFNGNIQLGLTGLPAGTFTFNPASISGGGTSTLTISGVASGTYSPAVTGTSGTITQSQSLSLFVAQPDSINTSCTAQISESQSAGGLVTINVQPLTPPGSLLTVTGLVDGVQVCSATSNSGCSGPITLGPGTHAATWTCSGNNGSLTGNGSKIFSVGPPGNVRPKYLILSVMYAPPGQSSSVDYGSSTILGSSTSLQLTQGRTLTNTLTKGVSFDIPQEGSPISASKTNSTTKTFSQSLETDSSISISKTQSLDQRVPGALNSTTQGIDHDFDVILLWVNPVLDLTVNSSTSAQVNGYTFDPADPVGEMDVVPVYVSWLKNPSLMPSGVALALARTWAAQPSDGSGTQLTSTDFQTILGRDPFANGATAIDQNRFSLTGETFAYVPPPNGGQPLTETTTLSYLKSAQQSHTVTDSYSVSFSAKSPDLFQLTQFLNPTTSNGVTLSFSTSNGRQSDVTQSQSATLSLVGPPVGYTGLTDLQVYQDNLYGTFMFAFVPETTFGVFTSTPNQNVTQGSSVTYAVSTTAISGFTGTIALSTNGLPTSGVTATFSPATLTGAGSSTLTISTQSSLAPGTYPFTIVGTVNGSGGTETHVASATLTVNGTSSYSLAISPAAQEVVVGSTTTYTVSTAITGGFNGTVNLAASSTLPSGAAYSFNPASITGAGSSTLTVTVPAGTAPGNYPLTVTGTNGNFVQVANADIAVTAASTQTPPVGIGCSVNITLNPAVPMAGQSVTFTANLQGVPPVNNDNASVTLDGQPLCSTPGTQGLQCSQTVPSSQLALGPHTLAWNCSQTGTGGNGSGSGTQSFTVAVGPAAKGTVNPKYQVLSVIYTPPGSASTVDYGTSTTVGTTTSIMSSFTGSQTINITLGANVQGIGASDSAPVCSDSSDTGNVTLAKCNVISQALADASSIALKKTTAFDIQVPGLANPTDGINHDYDIILVWLNPAINFNVTNNSNAQIPGFSFDPNDPAGEVDVVAVYVKWLKDQIAGTPSMPPAVANALARAWAATPTDNTTPALTNDDLKAILARDPFTDPNYVLTVNPGSTASTDGRFDLEAGETFAYEPPPTGGQPITEKFSFQFQQTSSTGTTKTDTYSTSFSISGSPNLGSFLAGNLAKTNVLTSVNKFALQTTNVSTQTATLNLTGPCVGYNGPTDVQVYQDNVYGTFMFAFVANTQAPDFSLCAAPATKTLNTSSSDTFTVFTSPSNGFSGAVALTITGLPTGVTASFSPSTLTGAGTSTLTINVPPSAAASTSVLTITGTSGTLTHTTTVTLVINAVPDFSIAATPASQNVNTGIAASTTVSTTAFNGFTAAVNLSASVSPSTGCNAPAFNPASITGAGSSTMTMTCPTAGNYTVTITGTSGTGSNMLTQTAQVTLAVTAVPVANLTPASLSFASQNVGTSSGPQTLTLSNSGTAALSITSIAASGDFTQTNNCGTSLAVGGSCTISVSFAPSATGTRSGTLTVTDNAAGSPHTASLSGTGIAPAVGLSPASLTFAGQNVGTTSAAQTVTLTNSGTAALTITSIAASGNFAQTNNCGATLAVNGNCTISVTFTPSASGTRTGTLSITDNAAGSPQSASLTGTGLAPAAALSPASLTFSSQTVGTTSAAQAVTLTNSGNTTMSISGITISGDFAQTNNCASTLAVNSSCTINVTFKPTATGTRTGTLTVTDNAPASPQTVGLSGTGGAAGPQTLRPTSFTSPGTPYANPANATDGNLTTFANGIVNGSVSFEYWSGFGSAGASPTAITLKVSSAANCIDPGDGNDGAEIAYSLDGGNTFHHIYAQGGLGADACSNRAQQTDVVSLPLTQDTTKIQVFAELASIHSSTHQVYDIWIEVSH